MIWRQTKSIFIHIPKTGGTSIEVYFKNYLKEQFVKEEKHLTVLESKRLYKDEWKNYFTFTFIRNPWERVFSYWYNYYNLFQQTERTKDTFLDFLYQLNNQKTWQGNIVSKRHLFSQVYWLSDNGELDIDFIGRFETNTQDFDIIRDILNIPKQYALPYILWMKDKPHHSIFYTEEHKNLVSDIYKDDIQAFNYRYEDCLPSK